MIENQPEKFILSEIVDNIICLKNSNYHEHEKYIINLQNENYENNLNIIQDEIFQISDQNSFLISSVYINVNKE